MIYKRFGPGRKVIYKEVFYAESRSEAFARLMDELARVNGEGARVLSTQLAEAWEYSHQHRAIIEYEWEDWNGLAEEVSGDNSPSRL